MGSGPTGLAFVTSGSYQYERGTQTLMTFTVGTEVELPLLATHIVCTEDALLSWIRFRWIAYSIDEGSFYEWYVIKCQSSDATQDLSTETVIEQLQRDKKILARGTVISPKAATDVKPVLLQWYNLKLQRGEELRLLINPLVSGTADHGRYLEIVEWRQVGA